MNFGWLPHAAPTLVMVTAAAGAALAVAVGVGVMRGWALRHMIVARPGDQSAHEGVVPRGAGVIISVVCCATLGVAWISLGGRLPREGLAFLIGAVMVTGVSWRDDIRPLAWYPRLLTHALAAGLVVVACGAWRVVDVPFLGHLELGWTGPLLAFVWVVGFTNAFNFMDGIDGIAGSQALVAGLSWWAVMGFTATAQGWLALLLAAASAGFLVHNTHPARVLMGDAGSIFLGFSLASLGVLGASEDSRAPFVAFLVVWPFVFDSSFTLVRRLARRENILRPHRSHLYQRLVAVGVGHSRVTSFYAMLALLGTAVAWGWVHFLLSSAAVAIGLVGVAAILLATTISVEKNPQRILARFGGSGRRRS